LRFTKCIQNIQLVAPTSSKINIYYLQIWFYFLLLFSHYA